MSCRHRTTEAAAEGGYALILALWLVLVVGALLLSISLVSRTSVRIVANLTAAAQTEALADAGIYYAVSALGAGRGPTRIPIDGRPVAFSYGGVDVHIRAVDERGKLNLRRVPPDIARKAFELAGLSPPGAAEAATHFSDVARHDPTVPSSSTEGWAMRPIVIGELRSYTARDVNLYRRLLRLFTLSSNQVGVVPAYASAEMSAVLSAMTESERQRLGIRDSDPVPAFTPLRPNIVGVHVQVRLPDGVEAERYAIVRLTGARDAPVEILYWE